MPPRLSLVVPAYNEAARIERTLDSLRAYLERGGPDWEIVVAADGADGTRERAAAWAAGDARVRVIGTPERRGKGRGVREGVALTRGRVVGFVDADDKTPIEEADKLLPLLERECDLAIGSRAAPGAQVEVPQRFYRRVGSRAFGVFLHLVLGLRSVRDTQCGFKFFRGEAARDLFARQAIDGYMFDIEILHLAERAGYRVREVGVRWRDDHDSRLDLVSGNWRNFLDVLRIRFVVRRPKSIRAPH
jgi:glycosyltransferase involved in cell wall biosynthesis